MSSAEERLPYPAAAAARANLGISRLPVSILLDVVLIKEFGRTATGRHIPTRTDNHGCLLRR